MTDKGHIAYLAEVLQHDKEVLEQKEREYQNSWKRRGGIGAFMMLARKWDRLEAQVEHQTDYADRYDIFAHAESDSRGEGLIDDIDDLRRYLTLVRAELYNRAVNYNKDRAEALKRGEASVPVDDSTVTVTTGTN